MINIEYYDSIFDIVEDYKDPSTTELEKEQIFDEFIRRIWSNNNKRTYVNRKISYTICDKIKKQPEYYDIFKNYSSVYYTSYRHTSKRVDWASLIRQKINNIYSLRFDGRICTDRRYKELLTTPKKLYYRTLSVGDLSPTEVSSTIDSAMNLAQIIFKRSCRKIRLSWDDYVCLVNGYLRRILDGCKTEFEYDMSHTRHNIIEHEWNSEKFYVRYFCIRLDGFFKNYEYEVSGLYVPNSKNKHKYKHCQKCGKLFIVESNSQKYCKCCSGYQKICSKKVICSSCGKEFNVPAKNNKTYRCKECQTRANNILKIEFKNSVVN